ncbi:hypothetical protein FHR83_006378 [Actinoplanes campanulatus]|uniref:Uncharacterized protein n=1 Tax=Actinoplanes campanulatus TaxID=113559 RepID=A0A7W5FHK0_9ACTN|nr:hypothetical protein [Actinoplanes campanulatus]MBB3098679.1 hypothetical protein [Actinoplanes campanulatus]GGN37586.1 hypothetical protein GCM10010109_63700 [Actinoplanes campanulatus]GID40821.1 hypothetical protein Aca09nite_73270 [Actinoplanes campanulatus]
MDALADLLGWFNTERTAVVIAMLALAGIAYSAQSASAAKKQAKSAKDQADRAKEQVELGKQQVDLMLRQVSQAEAVEAAAQQARRESLQPNVLVDIAPGINDPGVFVLSIANIGTSIARNVRIKALDEMVRSDGLKLHELTVFTEPISVMPPGQTRQFFYDVGFQPFQGKSPLRCRFEVDCEGPFGAVETAHYDIDLTPYQGGWAAPTTLHSVVDQLQKAVSSLNSIGRAIHQEGSAVRTSFECKIVQSTRMTDTFTTWLPASKVLRTSSPDPTNDEEAP